MPFNPKGKGHIEEEPSITGKGNDTYRYVNVRAVKNKLSVPNRETWLRIWVSDEDQQAHGLDPVWDTFYCLSLTGQVSGKRTSMLLNVQGLGEAKKNINWGEFKLLILGSPEEKAAVCKKLGYPSVNLRKGLFNLLKKGILEEMYAQARNASNGKKVLEVDLKSDDDDDEDAE